MSGQKELVLGPAGADKIAIIGSAPTSVQLAPYRDMTWACWGCSPGVYGVAPRKDAWFELHRWETQEPGFPQDPHAKSWFSPEYVRYMELFEGPVFMSQPIPSVKNCVLFPYDRLIKRHGPYHFTSTVAWMLAYAIEQKPKAIGLWGIDMAACLSYETRVLTADLRWVQSKDVAVGDKLIAFDENAENREGGFGHRRWRVADVLQADRLVRPCYRLYLEDGREIVCSEDHMWLTHAENECRWKLAKDLVTPHHREGRPTRIVKLCDTWTEDKSWEAGYLAAAFDGEGWLSQKLREDQYGLLRVGFAQRENAMSRLVAAICAQMGFEYSLDAKNGTNDDCGKYSVRGGRTKTMEFLGRIRPRRLMDKFDPTHLGLMQKAGTVAVLEAEYIGEQPVIGLKTSTHTFIAEGLASHNSEEYARQRPGCQHFLGLAKSMGIEIILPLESDLLQPCTMYGISEMHPRHAKLLARMNELKGRLQAHEQQQAFHASQALFLKGALDNLNYVFDHWVDDVSPDISYAISRSATIAAIPDPVTSMKLGGWPDGATPNREQAEVVMPKGKPNGETNGTGFGRGEEPPIGEVYKTGDWLAPGKGELP